MGHERAAAGLLCPLADRVTPPAGHRVATGLLYSDEKGWHCAKTDRRFRGPLFEPRPGSIVETKTRTVSKNGQWYRQLTGNIPAENLAGALGYEEMLILPVEQSGTSNSGAVPRESSNNPSVPVHSSCPPAGQSDALRQVARPVHAAGAEQPGLSRAPHPAYRGPAWSGRRKAGQVPPSHGGHPEDSPLLGFDEGAPRGPVHTGGTPAQAVAPKGPSLNQGGLSALPPLGHVYAQLSDGGVPRYATRSVAAVKQVQGAAGPAVATKKLSQAELQALMSKPRPVEAPSRMHRDTGPDEPGAGAGGSGQLGQ